MEKRERQRCEVYSRVVGYLRPVSQWNEGKQAEFSRRKEYDRELAGERAVPVACGGPR
jgi:ribonucleoside-triphosphate reductase (formate)